MAHSHHRSDDHPHDGRLVSLCEHTQVSQAIVAGSEFHLNGPTDLVNSVIHALEALGMAILPLNLNGKHNELMILDMGEVAPDQFHRHLTDAIQAANSGANRDAGSQQAA